MNVRLESRVCKKEGETVKFVNLTKNTHTCVPETMFLVCSLTSLGVSLKDE